jgi:glycine cleavage system H lipoate-binding protein
MVAIFVLSAFILILMLDHFVLKLQGRTHPAFEPEPGIIGVAGSPVINYELPSNIFLSKGHTWLKKSDDGLTEIGIDLLGSMALGGLSIAKCPEENTRIKHGDVLFVGNYGAEIVEFLSPIKGTVKYTNSNILGKKISNPYDSWGIKVYSEEEINMGNKLFSGKEAVEWIKTEFQNLKKFLEKHNTDLELVGETMFDGGASSDNSNSAPTKLIVNNFKKEFLSL